MSLLMSLLIIFVSFNVTFSSFLHPFSCFSLSSQLPPTHLRFLLTRIISEFLDLSQPRSADASESAGRTSGSLEWRSQRGETGEAKVPQIDIDGITATWTNRVMVRGDAVVSGSAAFTSDTTGTILKYYLSC